MRSRASAWGVLLLVSLGFPGCASGGSTGAPGPPAPTADDRLEMSRGPCFGACPIYRVRVTGDGRVSWTGERFVQATGAKSATIPIADVAALFAYADSVGFFGMPADITPANESACGGAWTDMPDAVVTIEWAGRAHTVRHYHGCPKAPEALTRLEERIDAVLRTSAWIGPR